MGFSIGGTIGSLIVLGSSSKARLVGRMTQSSTYAFKGKLISHSDPIDLINNIETQKDLSKFEASQTQGAQAYFFVLGK